MTLVLPHFCMTPEKPTGAFQVMLSGGDPWNRPDGPCAGQKWTAVVA